MDVLVYQGKTQRMNLSAREEQSNDCWITALLVTKTDGIGVSIGSDSQLEDSEQDVAR